MVVVLKIRHIEDHRRDERVVNLELTKGLGVARNHVNRATNPAADTIGRNRRLVANQLVLAVTPAKAEREGITILLNRAVVIIAGGRLALADKAEVN